MKALRYFVFKQLVKSKKVLKNNCHISGIKKYISKKNILKNIDIQVAHDGADKVENLQNKVKLLVKRKI